jgi:TRAP-type mannitol/chloroaromatic compound transport system substrate-binding protein
MKGLKFRTVGLSIDMFKDMGLAVNALPGGEIVPALDRGLLDAAEFNNASSDQVLGFPDVAKYCMLQSFHQCSEQFEILFNKKRYDALSPDLASIIAIGGAGGLGRHVAGRRSTAIRRPTWRCVTSRASSSTRRRTRS